MYLVLALTIASRNAEGVAASEGLLDDAKMSVNPNTRCSALLAAGHALRPIDPKRAHEILCEGLRIAHDSGNRTIESGIAVSLARLGVTLGDPMDALQYLVLAMRQYYDSGTFSLLRNTHAILTILLDRVGLYESAATASGFGSSIGTRAAIPELDAAITHLRTVLGDERFSSLARAGAAMSHGAIATYAFEQIDLARNQLQLDRSR
jgi:hypothetical protein